MVGWRVVLPGLLSHLFGVLRVSKSILISSMLGVPAAPGARIDLGTLGARSTPPVPGSIRPAGATGASQIGEINVDVELVKKHQEHKPIRHFKKQPPTDHLAGNVSMSYSGGQVLRRAI